MAYTGSTQGEVSMKRIEIIIYVEPKAKGRPRATMAGRHARLYTPKETRDSEADIKATIRKELMGFGPFDAGVPLYLSATFVIEKPKSTRKRDTMPVKRPDLDNYAKLLLDACSKYVYPDDSQIVTMKLRKRYGMPPRIELMIMEDLE